VTMPYFAIATGILTVVCGVLVIYPYTIYPLLLRLFPARPVRRRAGERVSATLVFCAYNEERNMPDKIANLEAIRAAHPDIQFLAFDDGSTDATAHLLAARPDLIELIQGGGRNGKAHGMKLLVARATGDIVIFTDANVLLREDAVDNLAAWYADPEVGGVCGSLQYIGGGSSMTASVGAAYWRLEEHIKQQESRTGNVMGADGSIFSLRRSLYPEFPDSVLDDLTVSMAAVFAGRRLIKVEDVVAFERLVSVRGEEFARKVRIAARAYHTHMHLCPQLGRMQLSDRFKYASHRSIRWFGGVFLVLCVMGFIGFIAAFSAALALATTVAILALPFLALRFQRGPVAAVLEICLAMFATLIGVFRAIRGQTVVTWAPAKSR
jgi:cellulose synthase/poly-beta-1,6-N-acetylglucosamine synthase-like glycosyltransferase